MKTLKTLTLLVVLPLTGCGVFGKTKMVDICIPREELPRMSGIVVQRPELEIHRINLQDENLAPDILVKSYVSTVRQLIDYSEQLELVVEHLQFMHDVEYEP